MAQLKSHKIDLPQSDIYYYANFLTRNRADKLMQNLRASIAWQHDDIRVFGKTYPQPRLTALYGNNGQPYSYSNITMNPHEFTDELREIKGDIEKITAPTVFTTCLLNLYRNGKDSNGWHADDEASLGINPVIASLSLGEERRFHFKHKDNPEWKHKMILEHGSLLIMKGSTQHHWLHQIPKTSREIGERINLTFRVIK
ncbi:alpha-ketoglutarate-dependent dioxygenase AlkB family protein [Muriicola soli]|uniref:Alpha-ketoglutarate-dependent dioxygenase AlkB n=1 Tax=Muriicola soli TaxID=2507538 RepID=A0A411E7Z2_9FLAO|nr:alpha-ketoglutarate-dependent dioxygenase AlkB [Muriicola soli]QBA63580.1 alpha-ketoglutarate-dependent dioxygenase AlkB [Muriicola soli]